MSKDNDIATPGEAMPKEKKSKKSKEKGKEKEKLRSKEKERKEEKEGDDNGDVERVESPVVMAVSGDGDEKKKKKKRKEEEPKGDFMVIDSEHPLDSEKKKKKKKRKDKSQDAEEQQTELMLVDSEEPSSKGETVVSPVESTKVEKKKKRKREPEAEGQDAGDSSSKKESKKERKKRRKETDGSTTPADALLESSTTLSSASTSKAASVKPNSNSPHFTLTSPTSPEDAAAFLAKHSITIHTPPSVTSPISPIVAFSQLSSSLPEKLTDAFKTFKEPSPIQACTWPPALEGRDVVGIAETGSGKTLAFGIPALNKLINSATKSSSSNISTLVVAPTRELAIQTHDSLSALGASFGIASVAIFGGVPKEGQIRLLKASLKKGKDGLLTRIVVGTPGRILDLMQDGVLDLSGVDYLVLDEADRMLDKGFENDIRNIISATKPMDQRQTMMFSATWPDAVRRLASTFQRDPIRVTVGSDDLTANSRVEQSVEVFDDARSKDQRLINHLKKLLPNKRSATASGDSRVLVFALYKKEASRVEQMLSRQGYGVGALHGDLSQTARMEALDRFKTGVTPLLVATDVAARGLDIPNVSAVINYTFPLTIEDYIHRIGRTGRGGKTGKSITFFTGDNHERSLAGEYARVLREGGFDYEGLKKFPMTIKKKEHGAYGAFFRDDIPIPKAPTKIIF